MEASMVPICCSNSDPTHTDAFTHESNPASSALVLIDDRNPRSFMKSLVKFEVVTAVSSFALIFVAGVAGHLAAQAGMDAKIAERGAQAAMLVLFCFFGFACIGLMIHVFTVMQVTGIGNGQVPMIRFLRDHEAPVTFAAWGFLGLGTLIAMPFALHDIGFRLPLRSRGVLVADIGMTLDEVTSRSTIKMHMRNGSDLAIEDVVFEFRIGDSGMRFPLSRYYWIETRPNDRHVYRMNIGITPEKMSKADLDAFQHTLQVQLVADGWMPGHYVADSEETVHMWGGRRTSQDGRYWLRRNTVLSFERKRMDESKPDEPPDAGNTSWIFISKERRRPAMWCSNRRRGARPRNELANHSRVAGDRTHLGGRSFPVGAYRSTPASGGVRGRPGADRRAVAGRSGCKPAGRRRPYTADVGLLRAAALAGGCASRISSRLSGCRQASVG